MHRFTRTHSDWGMAPAWSARWRVAWGGEVCLGRFLSVGSCGRELGECTVPLCKGAGGVAACPTNSKALSRSAPPALMSLVTEEDPRYSTVTVKRKRSVKPTPRIGHCNPQLHLDGLAAARSQRASSPRSNADTLLLLLRIRLSLEQRVACEVRMPRDGLQRLTLRSSC